MKRKPLMRQRVYDYVARAVSTRSASRAPLGLGMRRLRTEPLEERRMLSVGTTYVDDTLVWDWAHGGDVDGSGDEPDIDDLTYLVMYMFQDGPPPPVIHINNRIIIKNVFTTLFFNFL